MLRLLLVLSAVVVVGVLSRDPNCPRLTRADCCRINLQSPCFPKSCYKWINRYCPDRAKETLTRVHSAQEAKARLRETTTTTTTTTTTVAPARERVPIEASKDTIRELLDLSEVRRSAPKRVLGKCGTADRNFQPCTTRGIADKLFKACCDLYVPKECHGMCTYETDQDTTRNMLIDLVRQKECSLKHLSTVLFCASQNRDNRKCCAALDLNAPQLQVGSRCLRMCDPSGTAIERITKDDVTCLYNWNVIMYCHHSGIREM